MLIFNCSCVYLHADGSTSKFEIVRAIRGHFTAGMAWGAHASSNYLFASSASPTDGTGHHKMFDVAHNKLVVEFDAKREACSTLALDASGKCERLFIATEGPETTFNLRQFDVRARLRKPVQTVALEPFADITDKAAMDINSLSLSADGLYLAAGRTDNWVDVYDARALGRGPLHAFAHEESDKPDRRAMYGIVKTEWVAGAPYGVGLVSGGADGCVRLWDVRRSSDDPHNGTVLVKCDNDVSTFALGDVYKGEAPLIVYVGSLEDSVLKYSRAVSRGVCSGKVTVLEHTNAPYWE
ncbi:uncharacterized protein TRAVEDRAFT_111056 [Trametes versicolor FP-101664 SS1]|uniref:uncharacterized protein n=1 Tax=Trametes versicolor (strain FP-101664) TaxID=717944 RepID=UPI0004622FAE|nr:uncharacterized protein TRAVEDRAFT_111056 [Trametes versicolor FP-101664 SS1]EIW64779.1 hypothetical protein TRAVEDRAFT_111056 [Trametes versicolor FP-101664 SS1]